MVTFRYRDFPVYQDVRRFRKECRQILKLFPRDARFLVDQIERALLSIALNIAEGSAKLSDPDFARFMETSSGSINEVLAGFEAALDDGYISLKQFKTIENDAEHIAKQLGGFIRSLRKPSCGSRKL